MPKNKFFFHFFFFSSNDLGPVMKFKPDQCESFTRSSQYTVRCKRKGFFCKTSKKYRCPNHAGMSTGPKTKEGKLKALQNLKQYRNNEIFRTNNRINRSDLPRADDRSTINEDLQQQRFAKLSNNQQMDN